MNTLITKSSRNQLRVFFQENCKNTKTVWSKINETLQNKKNHGEDIFLSDDEKMINDQINRGKEM